MLQCANVGTVLGGTGACAWSVTRALPGCRHVVAFFGTISEAARQAFAGCELLQIGRLEPGLVRRVGADFVVLHNTPAHRVLGPLPAVTLVYHHSHQRAAAEADVGVYCSRWLAGRYGANPRLVCHQGVPVPPQPRGARRPLLIDGDANRPPRPRWRRPSGPRSARNRRRGRVVGRLCTPNARKWPGWLPDFYREMVRAVPRARWEFVGCPAALEPPLSKACGGRARFHPAAWAARSRLWHWDVLCYTNPMLAESFGRVCAEAMRTGCVPAVDAQGGFCEQVARGRSGFLCSTWAQFAAALAQLEDPAVRQRLSAAARRQADEQFSLRAFSARLRTWLAVAVELAE